MAYINGNYNITPLDGPIKVNGQYNMIAGAEGQNISLSNNTTTVTINISQFATGLINLADIYLNPNDYQDFVFDNGYRIRVKNSGNFEAGYIASVSLRDPSENIVSLGYTATIYMADRSPYYVGIGNYYNINNGITYRSIITIRYNNQCTFHCPSDEANTALNVPVRPTYHWESVTQLVGNNGQFRMNLSQIKNEYIGDGETTVTTQDNDKFIIEPLSSLRRISGNFVLDEERTIAWCGTNYATLTKHMTGDDLAIRIKLYFDPSIPAVYDTGYMYLYDPLDDYYLSFIYDTHNQAARIDLIHYYESNGSYWWSYNEGVFPSSEDLLDVYVWLEENGEISDTPYDTGTTDNGGDSGLPRPQDHIYTSPLPTKSGLGLGLIGLYHPTAEQLEDIADLLWSSTLIDNVLKYFGNFADNILGLYVLPFLPANLPKTHFTVGHYATDIDDVDYVTTRFYDIDMGSVPLDTLWDSYLDYEPYSRCQIYLPYIGMKDLDMDELMCPTDINGMLPKASGCTLSLLYRLDILTGSIVAQLKISNEYLTDEVRYQYSGKVGYNIPLTGETYNGIISSILNVATAGASALLSGGLTAPLVDGAAIAGTVQAQKGSVTHSGNLSGDVSMMGQKTPYIEISSPNKPYLDLQENFTGFPSYKSDQLDNFSGFTQVVEVHAEGFVCTESERTEIIRLLKEGVIL